MIAGVVTFFWITPDRFGKKTIDITINHWIASVGLVIFAGYLLTGDGRYHESRYFAKMENDDALKNKVDLLEKEKSVMATKIDNLMAQRDMSNSVLLSNLGLMDLTGGSDTYPLRGPSKRSALIENLKTLTVKITNLEKEYANMTKPLPSFKANIDDIKGAIGEIEDIVSPSPTFEPSDAK